MTVALSALAVLLAYVIGSIPFGFLTARWARGIDIRTVGSGNVGATNVGRILGFKYFVLVMLLDLLKGLGPTLGFPAAVEAITGREVPILAIPVVPINPASTPVEADWPADVEDEPKPNPFAALAALKAQKK